jgi:hypothetical protein
MTPTGHDKNRTALATRMMAAVSRRADLEQAVGVFRCWHSCDAVQARQDLVDDGGMAGQDAEAARVVAIVDAQAERRADPDWN